MLLFPVLTKIRPSLCAAQSDLLKEAKAIVEEYKFNEDFVNPVEFVFANIHGDIQLKFQKKFRKSKFVTFRNKQELLDILIEAQSVEETDAEYLKTLILNHSNEYHSDGGYEEEL